MRRLTGWFAIVVAAAAVTALSSSLASGASSHLGATRATTSDIAYAKAQVDQYLGVPTFTAPGAAISVSSLKGKSIVGVPSNSEIPFVQNVLTGEGQAASAAGLKYKECQNQGELTQYQQCIQQAIAAKAALLELFIPDVSEVGPQLSQAKSAGVDRIQSGADNSGKVPPGVQATVDQNLALVGKVLADYSIMYRQGKVDALVVETSEIVGTSILVNAIKSEFAAHCGSACKVTVVDVPITDWTTMIQTEVQSGITKDPNLNLVIPIYDGMASYAVAGINASGAASRVKLITFNGTPSVLTQIGKSPVVMDIGQPTYWIGWNDMDQAFRVLLGQAAAAHVNPIRVFDASNIASLGAHPTPSSGYGDAYIAGYKKLWGMG